MTAIAAFPLTLHVCGNQKYIRIRLYFLIQGISMAYVYILTNDNNTVLYTGLTEDLGKRLYLHKHRLLEGFTKKYNCHRLVYYEQLSDLDSAKVREKQIKGKTREKKIKLINSVNPQWHELSSS
jgi:putative endonuclease